MAWPAVLKKYHRSQEPAKTKGHFFESSPKSTIFGPAGGFPKPRIIENAAIGSGANPTLAARKNAGKGPPLGPVFEPANPCRPKIRVVSQLIQPFGPSNRRQSSDLAPNSSSEAAKSRLWPPNSVSSSPPVPLSHQS